jgi:hypothetical protein
MLFVLLRLPALTTLRIRQCTHTKIVVHWYRNTLPHCNKQATETLHRRAGCCTLHGCCSTAAPFRLPPPTASRVTTAATAPRNDCTGAAAAALTAAIAAAAPCCNCCRWPPSLPLLLPPGGGGSVGTALRACRSSRVRPPKPTHTAHCVPLSGTVLKARPPASTIATCRQHAATDRGATGKNQTLSVQVHGQASCPALLCSGTPKPPPIPSPPPTSVCNTSLASLPPPSPPAAPAPAPG